MVLQVASLELETLSLAPRTLPDKSRSRISLTSDLHGGHIQSVLPFEDSERAASFAHRGLGRCEMHLRAVVTDAAHAEQRSRDRCQVEERIKRGAGVWVFQTNPALALVRDPFTIRGDVATASSRRFCGVHLEATEVLLVGHMIART